jgi:glycosyltransferase involved in cell wall biosynthesis
VKPYGAARPTLTILQATHASLEGLEQNGLLERHKRLLSEYDKAFDVVLYTSDTKDYSSYLGVRHNPVPWLPARFGWRHLAFYAWLVFEASRMKGVIKVFGSNIPTLPIVRLLSACPMMVTFQFDYSGLARQVGKGAWRVILSRWMERLALKSADVVLVTTAALRGKVEERYRKPTVLLPNWVDTGMPDGGQAGRAREVVLYAGRLHRIKGVDVLVDAFARLKTRFPPVRLVICGKGDEQERLASQAALSGMSDVHFMGSLPNARVLELMGRANIFVLPTLTMEGHPKALIEAMACGAACIASDVPGNRDVIVDGKTGVLVPPGDAAALSDAMIGLIEDPSLADRIRKAGQAEAARYSFGRVVPREIAVLEALAGRHPVSDG